MVRAAEDWAAVLERSIGGDRAALAQLGRLVNAFLVRWGAYALRDEWDDLLQEVLLAAATAWREGRLRERAAVAAWLKATTHHKFVDRLKQQQRQREDARLPWEDAHAPAEAPPDPGLQRDLREALAKLPERERAALLAVYVDGCTYEEAASHTGIPLGSLKRHLRDGLVALRRALSREGGIR